MSKKRTSPGANPGANAKAFIAAAKAHEDETRWQARLKAIAKAVEPTAVRSVREAGKKAGT
jgi:hypothetical protein